MISLAGKAASSTYPTLLTPVRVFRVASSSAARPLSFPLLRSACCHCDSAPAPFACRNVTPHSEADRAILVSEVPVVSLRQYSIWIPIEIRLLRTDNLVDMVPAPLDFQYLVQFALTGWIVRRLGNNNFTCFARFSGKCIDHTSSIDQIYNIGIANRRAWHQKYKVPGMLDIGGPLVKARFGRKES